MPGVGADITPNATPIALSPYDSDDRIVEPKELPSQNSDAEAARLAIRQFGGAEDTSIAARVVLQFPAKADEILLSGELAGGQALTNRALALDQPLGQGHVVMFALRPFWRWQTQGTFALGFNTISTGTIWMPGRIRGRKRRSLRPLPRIEAEINLWQPILCSFCDGGRVPPKGAPFPLLPGDKSFIINHLRAGIACKMFITNWLRPNYCKQKS